MKYWCIPVCVLLSNVLMVLLGILDLGGLGSCVLLNAWCYYVLNCAILCMRLLGCLLCWCRNACTYVGLHLWTRLLANIIRLGPVLWTVVLTSVMALGLMLGLLRMLVTRSIWKALLLRLLLWKCKAATWFISIYL